MFTPASTEPLIPAVNDAPRARSTTISCGRFALSEAMLASNCAWTSALTSALAVMAKDGGLQSALALALAEQLALQSASTLQSTSALPPSHFGASASPVHFASHVNFTPALASHLASHLPSQVPLHSALTPALAVHLPSHLPLQVPSAWMPLLSAPAPAEQVPSQVPVQSTVAPASAVQL